MNAPLITGSARERGDVGARPAAGDPADPALSFWSFLWASAILFSLTSSPLWFISLASSFPSSGWFGEIAVALLALATMLRPASIPLLAALALAQVAYTGVYLPEVPNHRLIAAFANLSLLVAMVETCRAEGRIRPSAEGLWRRFRPAGRWLVLFLYGFAFFAKLNHDFLDPGTSCATRFYVRIVDWLPALPRGEEALLAVIAVTIAAEVVLLVLLAAPRLRRYGVLLGIAFHVALSFDLLQHLVNFSATMLALLFLFVRSSYPARVEILWRRAAGERAGGRIVRALACTAFLALIVVAFRAVADDAFALPYYVIRQVLFVAYGIVLFAAVALVPGEPSTRPGLTPSAIQAAILAVVVLNGASPYLGLKTRTSFNMYSNLRVEAEASNHLLVSRSADLLGILSDRVRVLQSSDPALPRSLTWFEFASLVNRKPGIEVLYERNGFVRHLGADGARDLPTPPPPLLRKLLVFRDLGESAAGECVW